MNFNTMSRLAVCAAASLVLTCSVGSQSWAEDLREAGSEAVPGDTVWAGSEAVPEDTAETGNEAVQEDTVWAGSEAVPGDTVEAGRGSFGPQTYAVMDEIYPFTPPQKLLDETDAMLDPEYCSYPVIMGIMPVYEHRDYPAMQEFLEVLRYAQSNGVVMMLHAPIVKDVSVTDGELAARVKDCWDYYTGEGILLQGVLYSREDSFWSGRADSLYEIAEAYAVPEVYAVPKAYEFPEAYGAGEGVAGIRASADQAGDVDGSGLFVFIEGAGREMPALSVAGLKQYRTEYIPREIDTDFDFHRNLIDNITISLEKQNKVLLVIVTAAIVLFILFIAYARRLNKRHLFWEEGEKEDDNH